MSSVEYVRRAATEYGDGDTSSAESRPLSAFRSEQAYVLLGDPGAGKTTAFRHEAKQEGAYVTARAFIRGDPVPGPKDATVFIDGLDEARAGGGDPRPPLDAIVARLRELGLPRFRVSCRPVDWGLTDTRALRSLLDGQRLRVLQLDPLGKDGIRDILNQLQEAHGLDVEAAYFVCQAEERGLGGLLDNPQSLQLLTKVVAATGTWPASRTDLFDEACRRLAREQNLEHIDATGQPPALGLGADDVLQAAGRLSALFLLTNAQAICRHHAEKQKDDLVLNDVKDANLETLSQVLATKLFAVKTAGRFTPVHAHIAEYVGARYLSDVVEGKTSGRGVRLPSARVVALLVGHDGEVVFGLRGLAAWLAALCREARTALIDADPIGVLAYGDAGGLDDADLADLIRALERRDQQILRQPWSAPALGSMIRPRTIEVLRRLVADDDRSDARQAVVDMLLRGVPCAAATPLEESPETEVRAFIRELLCLVRDRAWWPCVRQAGLEAALDTVERSTTGDDLVGELLQEINEGRVHDPDDELRGRLLTALYPHRIPPERVWDYVPAMANRNLIGHNIIFWFQRLESNTLSADLPALLNGLSVTNSRSLAAYSEREFDKLMIRLLMRALDAHGEVTPVSQLSKWIESAVRRGPMLCGVGSETPELADIRSWFAAHPKICQECLLDFLRRNSQEEDLDPIARRFLHEVFQNPLPPGFAAWCRERANELADSHAPAARLLRGEAVRLASLADLEIGKAASIQVQERVRQQETAFLERRRREEQPYIAHVRQHANDLAMGLCRPELLDCLAKTYFGVDSGRMPSDPVAALRDSLGSDERLVSAALSGFRRVLERDDLPDLGQIVRVDEAGKRLLFALPVLAGMAERDRTGRGDCRRLTDDGIKRAVGFYYISPHLPVRDSLDGRYRLAAVPAWYDGLVGSHPRLVAESLVAVHASKIRRKINYAAHLAAIARDTKYRELAWLAVPSLLRTFPVRCTRPQLWALRYLLWASVRYMPDELASWAGKKLARQSMDVAQQALWLCAGMMASPEQYLKEAMEFVREDSAARMRQLVEFVALDDMSLPAMEWSAEHLAMAVRGVGTRIAPWSPLRMLDIGKGHTMEPAEMTAQRLISAWLGRLAKDPGAEAADALNSLADAQQLVPWRRGILEARDQQADLRRAHLHRVRVPTADEVQSVLRDAEPANPGDLTALVVDRLKQLARDIRDRNTSDWRQYWNEGDRREPPTPPTPPTPKHEDFCRDALLSDLRNLLPTRVDAQPEGRYADDKRADIRVAYDGHAIPVEIKKNTHRKLWSAINDQLIAKYVRDPESDGFGVYLVLWFGARCTKTLPPPPDRRPKTPDELQKRLENQLPRDKRRKIKVVVVDVSRPEDRAP